MNLFYSLSLVATAIEMSLCLSSGVLLVRMRKDFIDRSRRMLAIGAFMSGLLALVGIAITISFINTEVRPDLLQPWMGLMYLSMHIVMTLYPISVLRPEWLTTRNAFFLFLPIAILAVVYFLFLERWTPVPSSQELWANAGKPDVLVRLVALFGMIPYCFIPFLLPYSFRRSSATFKWILNYSLGLFVICGTHIFFTLTQYAPLFIAMPLLVSAFFFLSLEFELFERLRPGKEEAPEHTSLPHYSTLPQNEAEGEPEGLWPRIVRLMDEEEVWRNPDLTLVSMSHLCATNVTYLNREIQQQTGGGFKEMLNKKRVADVAAQLKAQPDLDIQAAFFNAGYRSRTTAWRNFKEIIGQSPAEFKQDLK